MSHVERMLAASTTEFWKATNMVLNVYYFVIHVRAKEHIYATILEGLGKVSTRCLHMVNSYKC